jgi:hypothetical protein
MKNTTKRMMTAIIALVFAATITSCKKETSIEPTPVVQSPLTGVWIHEEQLSASKKLVITETINNDLTGEEKRQIVAFGVEVLSTQINNFTLQKLQEGFIQNYNLGPSISVNYSISIDNTTMIKDLEGARRQAFRRVN